MSSCVGDADCTPGEIVKHRSVEKDVERVAVRGQICDADSRRTASCTAGVPCADGLVFSFGECVSCVGNADCLEGFVCVDTVCEPDGTCSVTMTVPATCVSARSVCSTARMSR